MSEKYDHTVPQDHLAYWTRQLKDVPLELTLPTDRPRPATQTFQRAHYSFMLPKRLAEALKMLSQNEEITLFMTLLAAFQTLLFRYTGQEDVCVGSSIVNRPYKDVEHLVDFVANYLVMRTSLSGNPTFRAVLERVRKMATDAYLHQDMPFEKLVEELQPERDLSHHPFFQVLFVLQDAPTTPLCQPGVSVEALKIEDAASAFDLELAVWEREEGLEGDIRYNTDLFDTETIVRLQKNFDVLLEEIVVNPDQCITTISLLTPSEYRQIIVEWNTTSATLPTDACFHHLFEEQVNRTPEAIAAISRANQISYRLLNQRANQLARHLREQGVGPEVLVALYIERSIEMLVGILGILKAGGAYVPLDPMYPQERLSFIVADAQVSLILTTQYLQKQLSHHEANFLCLDLEWPFIVQKDTNNLTRKQDKECAAYVMYTSGSTGRPKGVVVTQQGFVNYVLWCSHYYGFSATRGSFVHTSLAFDLTITSLFPPLIVGGYVVFLTEERRGGKVAQAIQEGHTCNVLKLTPSHMELLNQILTPENLTRAATTVIVGGEALTKEHIALWCLHAPSTRLINEYGPTETVVGCCIYEVGEDSIVSRTVPIGHPIANTQLYVLDNRLQPVPIGVPGELYIGGVGLARGYLHRPELTAASFIGDPFSGIPGARLYKTGDIVRHTHHGVLEYIGRIDQQIKLRGYRIEPGEIETLLNQHAAVQECIVLVQEDTLDDRELIAYVVVRKRQTVSSNELRDFLQHSLPGYMIPSAFLLLDRLPLTSNGKVDRSALANFHKETDHF